MIDRLSAPLDVEIGLTGRCQLRCSYCSAMPFDGSNAPTERILKIVQELQSLGVFSLLISGGEPTIHPDFFQIMEASANSVPSLTINTNGLRLAKKSFAATLSRVAPNALVAVSLDSPDIRINNLGRGAGGAQAIQAIDNCVELGLAVCVSAVLTETNLDTTAALIDRFAPAVRKYRFFPQIPTNADALINIQDVAFNNETKLFDLLKKIHQRYQYLEIFTPYGKNPTLLATPQGRASECICSQTKLYINSRLEAFPCFYSAGLETKLGDCLTHTIAQIWNSARAQHVLSKSLLQRLCQVEFGTPAIPARYKQAIALVPARTKEE
jgi:MoaA/NifB/PqqE/SkfB family radical SAM enzyme